MEAQAKHDFNATAEDELSFKKGSKLTVISKNEDINWFKAEVDGKEGLIPNNYIDMLPHDWYHGEITRQKAEAILLERKQDRTFIQPDGAFLIRNSESSSGFFSLSVKFGEGVQHFKILRDAQKKYFLWVKKFHSLNELVAHHRQSSVSKDQEILLRDMVSPMLLCKAQFDFEASEDSEINLQKNDEIQIIEKSDENWWKGINKRTGKCGIFPATYVAMIK